MWIIFCVIQISNRLGKWHVSSLAASTSDGNINQFHIESIHQLVHQQSINDFDTCRSFIKQKSHFPASCSSLLIMLTKTMMEYICTVFHDEDETKIK